MELANHHFSVIDRSRIDKAAGKLRGVSVISLGEAQTHGVEIDEKTIEQILALFSEGGRLMSYWTHDQEDAKMGKEVGYFDAFRRDGNQLRADFTALEPFRKHSPSRFDYLFALAESAAEAETSTRFGVSIRSKGHRVWRLNDGSEVPYKPGDTRPDNAVGKLPAYRVTAIASADFTNFPAANESLFAVRKLTELLDAHDTFSAQVADLTGKLTTTEAAVTSRDSMIAELTVKAESASKTLDEERTAFAAKETTFATERAAWGAKETAFATQISALSADIETRKKDAEAKEATFKAEMQKMSDALLEHGVRTLNTFSADIDHRATWAAIKDPAEKTHYFQTYKAEILRL